MQSPTQQTTKYQGIAPSHCEPERARVALIRKSRPGSVDDLYALLRRRLLAGATILIIFWSLNALNGFWLACRYYLASELEQPVHVRTKNVEYVRLAFILMFMMTAVWWLSRRPPKSVAGLRVVETLILTVIAALQLSWLINQHGDLSHLSDVPSESRSVLFSAYTYDQTLGWFAIIVMYGAIIPNTLRRCLAVAGGLAICPIILFSLYSFWIQPLPWQLAADFLIVFTIYLAMAVAIAAFSSSRIERYRQQAAEARKLGQYVIKQKLGDGGMGEVYLAEHALLRRPCAIKLIRTDRAGDPNSLRRFEREVQITATLTHPNTVQVFDYGHADDGTFYYVMEYLPGLTLEELVKRHGPLSPSRAIHLLRQVCMALFEAHSHGLTHRDIKPGNVMVCERGGANDVVKVVDFGLVRVPSDDENGGTLSREGTIAGTPAYMSPEQVGGQNGIDARSDIYSVGALAYFLLTGKPPFAGRSALQMMVAHLYETPNALPADVPVDLAEVVMRCLAKSPSDRWPDAASLEMALAGTQVAVWSALDARAWWDSQARSTRDSRAADATSTPAEPGTVAVGP